MLFELLLPSQHPGHKLLINTQILRDAPSPQIPAEHPKALHRFYQDQPQINEGIALAEAGLAQDASEWPAY